MGKLQGKSIVNKVKTTLSTAKTYWTIPPKGKYVTYKEIASLSGAGFGVHWLTLLASTIGLNASNFLVGACIELQPMDLQIMLNVANLVGIPLGIFRSWYYDNHNLKGGKFLPFIQRTGLPIFIIPLIFVWLPYDEMNYLTKAIVVWVMYLLLNIFLSFYNESYTYFQQIITPDAQERANVMSISQVIYSLAPTITNLAIPLIAGLTWGLTNIWTYRVIYPVFTVIGLILSTIFFKKVKERLILPKRKPEPVRMLDAIREVAKNKYYWITQAAGWVVFLESGYGVILSWSFVYADGGSHQAMLGIANTVIGNAALWSMLLAPFAIKKMGKRNLLICINTLNIIILIILYFTYKNLLLICILWYINTFFNTFWNIIQHNISADMRDYHQWKTGVRVDGLFGPLGMIGTVISFGTGLFYPAIYEKMGLVSDYSVLYDDNIRNNLFEVLIICSAFGALLNLIPFFFYDLTENKHKAYVQVLKIRTMFENKHLGQLDDAELVDTMEIILNTKQETHLTNSCNHKERKLALERAQIITDELEKFSGVIGQYKIQVSESDVSRGESYYYENASYILKQAKALPRKSVEEKQIRDFAIKNARIKKESARLMNRYGKTIEKPDKSIKHDLINAETKTFVESIKIRIALKNYLKKESVYLRITKPYRAAKNLLEQAEYYKGYGELEAKYYQIVNS